MIDFEDLTDRFYNPVYCDIEERPKLRQALHVLCERMPLEVYNDLPDIILFAQSRWKHGVSLPLVKSTDAEAALVYIPPHMEEGTQEQNNFTIAHEFAHVSLRHHKHEAMRLPNCIDYLYQPNEIAADELVKRWGYEIPAYKIKNAGLT